MKRRTSLRVTAEVDVLSVDTANKDREKHLLTPDFFDARRFAVARFTSTRTVPGENKTAQVTGNLTIRDVTREVTFAVKCLGYGPDQAKGKRAGFHAETRISRQDFGVSYPGTMPDGRVILGDDVDLILEIEAVEKEAAAAAPAKSLAERLAELKAASPSASTPEVAAALARAKKEIKARGGVEGLKIGERAPDFTLPDAGGTKVSLADALAKGPCKPKEMTWWIPSMPGVRSWRA